MNFKTMNRQRKFIFITACMGIVAMFLPWIRISFLGFTAGSINGMHDWGILIFLCFIVAAVVTLTGDQTKPFDKTMWMITLIVSALAAIIMLINFLRALDVISFFSFGFYMALIASLTLLYCTYSFRATGYNIKDGFSSLKNDIEKKKKNDTTTPPSSN